MLEILNSDESRKADEAAIKGGISGFQLMKSAGVATAWEIRKRWDQCKVAVLCGPGNNGGDGFIIARELLEYGFDVQLQLSINPDGLKGDAYLAHQSWGGKVEPFSKEIRPDTLLVVDAIFGTGLKRPVEGDFLKKLKEAATLDAEIIAVDIPSGISADTGEVLGFTPKCALTVTFFRKKIGHLLMPGKEYCGEQVVADIGIKAEHIGSKIHLRENSPEIWQRFLPKLTLSSHKYTRGHAIVAGGDSISGGAARLAARAALRSGAGLVTIAIEPEAAYAYAPRLDAIMLETAGNTDEFKQVISDKSVTGVLVGPGSGITEDTKTKTLAALKQHKSCVIDGDAITVFRDNPKELFDNVKSPCVMTPHEGEFRRLFERSGNKLEDAINAAKKSGIVIVYKGSDTIIAAPDGNVLINENAPPFLATAGSGDVLAGITLGLLTQGMNPFYAAAAAVWMHSRCGELLGIGLIAEDLTEQIPAVLKELYS